MLAASFSVREAQSGRTSAPIIPHRVQTIRWHNERTGVASGSQSAFMPAL
jgi:hypothetical protein